MIRGLGIALTALILASCSQDDPVDRVLHLDPRLEDGRSSAQVLASRRRVVEEWAWTTQETVHAAWDLRDAKLLPTDGGSGALVAGTTPEPGRLKRVTLQATQAFSASRFNVVELVLGETKGGATRVSWWTAEAGLSSQPPSGQIEVSHGVLEEPTTLRLVLDAHPEWSGDIRSFRITPNASGPQVFALHAIRLLDEGFAPGASPLDEQLPDRSAGDGGLIARDLDMRRAWPTDWHVPLYVRDVSVPTGGRVELAFACARASLPAELTQASCTIAVRTGTASWQEVARRSLDVESARATRWHPVSADLSEFEGQMVDLRIRAEWNEDSVGELERASVFIGEPLIVAAPTNTRPNVVLVTIDTTRADAVGAGALTPFLDGLAEHAIVAANHWSASNATTPSHASLLTGLAVQDHGATSNHSRLIADNVTLAEAFRAAGWQTAAAVSVDHLRAPRSGLGQGFDRFWLSGPDAPTDGAVTIDAVTRWLEEWRTAGERPFFLWVHLFDPHTPYGPPEQFLDGWPIEAPPRVVDPGTIGSTLYAREGRFLEGVTNEAFARWLYGASVSYADELAARLASALEASGPDRTALIVTSDHGESLGEHDIWYQHAGLYPEVLQVPLYLSLPGTPAARIETLTSALDVPATLFAWAGLERPDGVRGRDLLTLAREPDPDRKIWFEHSHQAQVGSRDERYHFIQTVEDYRQLGPDHYRSAGERELFDHLADPKLGTASSSAEALEAASRDLAGWKASALGRASVDLNLTPAQRAELEALGYFGE